MMTRLKFWLKCSRWYALPMSVFSWLVIFVYSTQKDGNVFYGLLTLIGVCCAHLATNLFDDFFDFQKLKKNIDENDMITLPNTQRGKCRYLLDNSVGLKDVLKVIAIYCTIAVAIGLYLSFTAGKGILLFMGLGAVIVILYSFMSNIRLSELAVALSYGPLLFCGTYYAMTGQFSYEPLVLCIPTMIFTVNLLYSDTFLDREIDKNEGKKTFVGIFKSYETALSFQKKMLFVGYLSVFLVCIFDIADWQVFLSYLTIPLAVDLLTSLSMYGEDNNSVPNKQFYHFPFEDWDDIQKNRSLSFMFRMYQARNLMIYFSILYTIGLVLS